MRRVPASPTMQGALLRRRSVNPNDLCRARCEMTALGSSNHTNGPFQAWSSDVDAYPSGAMHRWTLLQRYHALSSSAGVGANHGLRRSTSSHPQVLQASPRVGLVPCQASLLLGVIAVEIFKAGPRPLIVFLRVTSSIVALSHVVSHVPAPFVPPNPLPSQPFTFYFPPRPSQPRLHEL